MTYKEQVMQGKGRGKQIGFPTLNLSVPGNFPYEHGIYGGWATIRGKKFCGAFHFGPIPAFGERSVSLEVYLIDAEIKKTPSETTFELVKYIRKIKDFENGNELSKQIRTDVDDIKKAFACS